MPTSMADQIFGMELPDQLRSSKVHDVANPGEVSADKPIAVFSAYYSSHGGGMEFACAELVRALLRAGMQVEWVAQADNAGKHDLSAHCTPLPGTDIVYALTGVPMPLPMPWTFLDMSRIVKRSRVVVIAEANFIISAAAFIVAKLHRKPILLVQHVGKPSTVSKLAGMIMRLGEALVVRPMVRAADVVVCVSPVVARYFANERTKSACLTIGHGVNLDCFRIASTTEERNADRGAFLLPSDGKVACFVGRLTESKGISVIAEMVRLRPDWTFAIAGIGPVDPLKWNRPNVLPLGQLTHNELARLYRASDVMVLPSQSESFSLVVREALACGCAVLCADQILETDPGLEGLISTEAVDLGNVDVTARRFAAALDRPARSTPASARDYVARQCSWAAVNERYVRLINGLGGDFPIYSAIGA